MRISDWSSDVCSSDLGIFFGAGIAQRKGDYRSNQYDLPAPEGKGRQLVAEQARLTGTLHDIIRGGKQGTAPKRKNHTIGVQRTQASVAEQIGRASCRARVGHYG